MNSYVTGDGRKTGESGFTIVQRLKTTVESKQDLCLENNFDDSR